LEFHNFTILHGSIHLSLTTTRYWLWDW